MKSNPANWPAPIALATPQPGDFCCVPISGGVGWGIEVGQFLDGDKFQPYEHAEIYVGLADDHAPNGYTVSAYPKGASKDGLPTPAATVPGSLWSSGIIDLTPEQRTAIVAWALDHLGTPYSFLDYAALAAHGLHLPVPLLRAYIANTKHLICSQYVDSAYDASGVHLFDDGRWPGFVKPGDLAMLLQQKGHLTLAS